MNIILLFWILLSLSLIGYFFNNKRPIDEKKPKAALSKLRKL